MRWIPLFLCFTLSAFGQESDHRAGIAAVRAFYEVVLAFTEPGVPSEAEVGQLKGLASRELRSLLEKARKAEALYVRKTHGEAPPLIESRLFFSLFEGAHRLESVTPEHEGAFLVELSYTDRQGTTTWRDRVHLVKERRRWVVDDIERQGEWAFGDKGRVQDALRAVIRTAGETPCNLGPSLFQTIP